MLVGAVERQYRVDRLAGLGTDRRKQVSPPGVLRGDRLVADADQLAGQGLSDEAWHPSSLLIRNGW
jgi:hypothetical protein